MKLNFYTLDIWADMVSAIWTTLTVVAEWLYAVTLQPLAVALAAAWGLTIDALSNSGLGIFAVPACVAIWTFSVLLILFGIKILVRGLIQW